MLLFNKFPVKLQYKPNHKDAPIYEVEIFGYVKLDLFLGGLIAFRRNSNWVTLHTGQIELLPTKEFDDMFKGYELVKMEGE